MNRSLWGKLTGFLALLVLVLSNAPVAQAQQQPTFNVAVQALSEQVASGEPATFRLSFSCSGADSSCEDSAVEFDMAELGSQVKVQNASRPSNNSAINPRYLNADGGEVTASLATKVRWDLGTVRAGANGEMTVTVIPENYSTPNGYSLDAEANSLSSNAHVRSAKAATAVEAKPDVGVKINRVDYGSITSDNDRDRDRAPGKSQPLVGADVKYQVQAGFEDGFRYGGVFKYGSVSKPGQLDLEDVTLVVKIPEHAKVVDAARGTYDESAGTITWQGANLRQYFHTRAFFPVLNYPSEHFTTDDVVRLEATVTGTPIGEEDPISAEYYWEHGFQDARASGLISKGASSNDTVARGEDAGYQFTLTNNGNVPLEVLIDDRLPCGVISPQGEESCDGAMALEDVFLRVNRTAPAGTVLDVQYTTTEGRELETTVNLASTGITRLPVEKGEQVERIRVTGTLPPGTNSAYLNVFGTVSKDVPREAPEGTNYRDRVARADTVKVQNIADELSLTPPTGNKITATRLHANIFVGEAMPIVGVDKSAGRYLSGSLNSVNNGFKRRPFKQVSSGDTMPIYIDLLTGKSTENFYPVIADLLQPGQTYKEDSLRVTARNWPSTLPIDKAEVETIDDYNGTGRQLVRITWPDEYYMPPSQARTFLVFDTEISSKVPAAVEAKPLMNEVFVSDAKNPKGQQCLRVNNFFPRQLADKQDLLGLGEDRPACTSYDHFTMAASAALSALTTVRGDDDEDFSGDLAVAHITPGNTGEFKLDITNNGNVALKNVFGYDLLPFVRDSGVLVPDNDRGSQWNPILTGPVEIVGDTPTPEILYSTSSEPCRGDLITPGADANSAPESCRDSWLTAAEVEALPGGWKKVRAMRFDFGEEELPIGETWSMILPVTAPEHAQGIAYDSFGVVAKNVNDGTWLQPIEPNQVGLALSPNMSFEKLVDGDQKSFKVGDEITWKLNISNKGKVIAEGVVAIDELPEGLEYVSSKTTWERSPADAPEDRGGEYDAGEGVWRPGALAPLPLLDVDGNPIEDEEGNILTRPLPHAMAPGESATLEIVTKVTDEANSQELCNESTLSTSHAKDKQSRACVNIVPYLKLEKSVVDEKDNYQVGDEVTWDVKVTNAGSLQVEDVQLADQLPKGMEFVSSETTWNEGAKSSGGEFNEDSGLWSPADIGDAKNAIAPGDSATVRIVAKITEDADLEQVCNTATVEAAGVDELEESACVNMAPDLSLEKKVVGETDGYALGEKVTWELNVSNPGRATAKGVELKDELPKGLKFIESETTWNEGAKSSGGEFNEDSGLWSPGAIGEKERAIAPGDTATVTIVTEITEESAFERICNSATIAGDSIEEKDAVEACVGLSPDLTLEKKVAGEDGEKTYALGDEVTWELKVSNPGRATVEGVELEDQLPEGMEFVSSETTWNEGAKSSGGEFDKDSGLWSPDAIGEKERAIAPGDTATVKIVAKITEGADFEQVCNTATAKGSGVEPQKDDACLNMAGDLTLEKKVVGETDGYALGDKVTWELKVSNPGRATVEGVELEDQLPEGMEFLESTTTWNEGAKSSGGEFAEGSGLWSPDAIGEKERAIAPGDTATVKIVAKITEASDFERICNSATVVGGSIEKKESDDACVNLAPDLTLEKKVIGKADGYELGEKITWQLKVSNPGRATVEGVELEDQLPEGMEFVESTTTWNEGAKSSGGEFAEGSGLWSPADIGEAKNAIAPGDTATVTIVAKITEDADLERICNTATARASGVQKQEADACANMAPDLALEKSVVDPKDNYLVGDEVAWQLKVTNPGRATAEDVLLTDGLPEGLEYVSDKTEWSEGATSTGGSYDQASGQWRPGTVGEKAHAIAPGETATVTIVTKITDQADLEEVCNAATLKAKSVDEKTDKACASMTPDLALEKSIVGPKDGYQLGDDVTWELKVSNPGRATVEGVELEDQLPEGMEFLSSETTWSEGAKSSGGEFDEDSGLWSPDAIGEKERAIAPGDTATVTIVAKITEDADLEQVCNTATAKGSGVEEQKDEACVAMSPDLALEKVVVGDKNTYKIGDEVTWELKVSNPGRATAEDVLLSDDLPEGLEFVSSETSWKEGSKATGGEFDEGSGQWRPGAVGETQHAMAPGDEATVTIVTKIAKGAKPGQICNSATAEAAGTGDRDDSDCIELQVPPTESGSTPGPGQTPGPKPSPGSGGDSPLTPGEHSSPESGDGESSAGSDDAAGADGDGADGADGESAGGSEAEKKGGWLASTGVSGVITLLGIGAALLLLGGVLMSRRRS